jgi:hypothetical protein
VKKLTKKKKNYAVHPHTYKKEKKKKKEISVEKSRIFYKTQKDNRKGGGAAIRQYRKVIEEWKSLGK